ncbi:MAG: membrane protein insertase YidC [Actinobacteria bacterium]|nr:membrane protein insertase YidC [Actinomycetota bacterium]
MDGFLNFFSPLSDFFFWILRFLHENLGISWSWAIVVLTLIIRLVLVPLMWRQIKSMRAMQALQPQLKALQEKYKNDRQVLNQKVMEFYHANNVSPFSSCLPLLLQMPVFLGLFYMLRAAGEAAGVGDAGGAFVYPVVSWLWIADITKFDYILMFLYIVSQFAASWQMSRNGASQQKIISYAMPIMVGVFMFIYKWPAGLFIYWFTSNLWTIAQQFVAERLLPVHVAPVSGEKEKKEKAVPGRASSGKGQSQVPGKTSTRPGTKTPAKRGVKTSGKAPMKPGAKTSGKPSARAPSKPSAKPAAKPAGKTSGGSAATKSTASGAKRSGASVGNSGGKTSGQKTGQKGKAASSEGQRADGGSGRPKSSGGA